MGRESGRVWILDPTTGEPAQVDSQGRLKVDTEINVSGDITIGDVRLKDGDSDNLQAIKKDNETATGTPNVGLVGGIYKDAEDTYDDNDATPLHMDVNGNLKVTGGASSVIAEFMSPSDFTATYTSSSTLTLSALPFSITDSSQLVYAKQILSGGTSEIFVNGSNGHTLEVSSDVITIKKNGTAITTLASGDVYEVGINAQKKAYDAGLDVDKSSVQNPDFGRNTDAETLVSSAQDISGVFTDLGSEIDCQGYKNLFAYLTIDMNNCSNVRLKVLGKHTSAGAEEYLYDHSQIKCPDVTGTSGDTFIEFDTDADQLPLVQIPVDNALPYIQLQVQMGTSGDPVAQIDKAYITRGY